MFDIVTFSLASAVADSGTVTVGYPSGRSQGDYDWAPPHHKLVVNGNVYSAPADFTLTFNANASDITLTNASGATWPASASCSLQIARPGPDQQKNASAIDPADTDRIRQIPVSLHILDLGSPDAADANGYVESQDLTSAGVFSVNTTAAAAIAAAALAGEADVPRNVVAAWTGTAVLTVTGTDEYGETIVESSGSGTSLAGKKAFKTVTGVSSSANITSLTVGTGDVLGLPVRVGKEGMVLKEYKDGAPVDVADIALSTSDTYTDSDVNTAVNAAILDINNHITGTLGTFVAAVDTEASATTGDVRGTYDPADAMDGDIGIKLLVALADPDDKGTAQYGG